MSALRRPGPAEGADRAAAPGTGADLLAEAQRFLREYAIVLALAFGALLLAYGFALTTFSISIDEEARFLGDRNFILWEQGRWVVVLVKSLVGDIVSLPFYNLALVIVSLFAAGVLWAFLFTHALGRQKGYGAGLLLFLVVFLTLPVNAFYLTFGSLNIGGALGFAWAAAAAWCAWLWGIDRRGRGLALAAVGFSVLAVGTYQAFGLAAIAGVLVAQLARRYALAPRAVTEPTIVMIRGTVRLGLPLVVGLAIGTAIHLILTERGGYTDGFFSWGGTDPRTIIERLLRHVGSYLVGEGFVGGWVVLPTVAAGALLAVLAAMRAVQERTVYPLLLLFLVFGLPFGLSLALGTPLPNRALVVLSLVAGSIWLLLAILLPRGRVAVAALLTMALLLALWDGNLVGRLFLSEQAAYETDVRVGDRIMERVADEGWDGSRIPLVVVGRRPGGPTETVASDETFGASFFNWDRGFRSQSFLITIGYPIRLATPEERSAAVARSASMPTWPAAGSVILQDGVAIVKFAEP